MPAKKPAVKLKTRKRPPGKVRLRADSPIDISDTSSVNTKSRLTPSYTIDSDFLIVTSGSCDDDAIISARNLKARSVEVLNASPAFSQSLSGATPWTLTINGSVTLSSDDNHRIVIDFNNDNPRSAMDGTIVFGQDLRSSDSVVLTIKEKPIIGGTQVFPRKSEQPPNGGFHVIIHYS
jgi:hypothetical protein